jgi:heme/copper-type cytochrome/quinol oxidase subunit 1
MERFMAETSGTPDNLAAKLSVKDAVAIARDVAVLSIAFLFPIGYLYRWYYLDAMALPIHANPIELNETLTDASIVLINNWFWIIGYLICLFAVYRLGVRFTHGNRRLRRPKNDAGDRRFSTSFVSFVIIGTVGSVILADKLAISSALDAASDIKKANRQTRLAFGDTASQDLKAYWKCVVEQNVIDETGDELFVSVRVKKVHSSCHDDGRYVVRIPRSAVDYISAAI